VRGCVSLVVPNPANKLYIIHARIKNSSSINIIFAKWKEEEASGDVIKFHFDLQSLSFDGADA
jgi:hypothetical protein